MTELTFRPGFLRAQPGFGVGPLYTNNDERGGSSPNGKPSLTVEGAAGMIGGGNSWGPGATVTFAFRSTAGDMPSDISGFTRFNAQQIAQTLLVFQSWSDVANINFQRVGSGYSDSATILLANYDEGAEGAAAFAFGPGDTAIGAVSGDAWFNSTSGSNLTPNNLNYGRQTLTHELGHAIGLSHPGDYDASEGEPTYETSAEYYEDTRQYSVMSYWSVSNSGAGFSGAFGAAPLLDDIAAVQLLYGANMSTRTGDTTYGFNSNTDRDFYSATGLTSLIFAVWDAGGYDTLDFSGYSQNQVIDLRQGNFSNVGGLVGNVAIAQGAVVERAIGGSGADTMYAQAYVAPVAVADLVKTQAVVNTSIATAMSVNGSFHRMFDNEIISSTAVPHATVQATSAGGYNYYSVTVGAGETLTVEVDNTAFDSVMRLHAANGSILASNDDGPRDVGTDNFQDSFISYTFATAGTYYISIGVFSDAPPSGGHTAYTPLPAGTTYTLNLSLTGVSTPGGAVTGSRLDGGGGNDTLIGQIGADELFGGAGDDQITGAAGDDLLDGGIGMDTMTGGAGDDTYVVERETDNAVEAAGEGVDLVNSSVTYVLETHVENLTLTGSDAINATGNELNNVLTGNAGANVLTGGAGDDTYFVQSGDDVVVEASGQGTDRVNSALTYALGAHIEELVLTGSANIDGMGNSLANVLIGNAGSNTLNGGAGADSLRGGAGSDIYYVDHVGDRVVELNVAGVDLVYSSVSFSINGVYAENLILTGSANINAVGNGLANTLTGNGGNNTLNGGTGADIMRGGAGADLYYVDNAGDRVIEANVSGADRVISSVSFSLNSTYAETLTLSGSANINATGNGLANTLVGNAGNNTLNGGTGADIMRGNAGNDIYYVDNAGDRVIEANVTGIDRVISSVTFSINGIYAENITLTGAADINATGNSFNNHLIGNAGNNILQGAAGNDIIEAGLGRDTLRGGDGVDRFVWNTTAESTVSAPDRILDLTSEDIIDLRRVDADTTTAGVQDFALVDAFSGDAGQLIVRYLAGSNTTFVEMDVNGDGVADMRIRIDGDHSDFDNFLF